MYWWWLPWGCSWVKQLSRKVTSETSPSEVPFPCLSLPFPAACTVLCESSHCCYHLTSAYGCCGRPQHMLASKRQPHSFDTSQCNPWNVLFRFFSQVKLGIVPRKKNQLMFSRRSGQLLACGSALCNHLAVLATKMYVGAQDPFHAG